jgi:hypothetical protein
MGTPALKPSPCEVSMFRQIVFSALLLLLPAMSWAQAAPRFEILAFIDNQWTVIDSTGAFVRTLPIQPAQRPGSLSLNHDETKLLLLVDNWQTWLYDFQTETPQFLFQSNWNAASHWMPGSSTEIVYNQESGSLFKFNTLLGVSTLWQSNDTIGGRVLSRVQFGNGGQSAVMNVHFPAAGGMGVYLGDVCYADASHALCNLRALAWPGNGSTSWSDVAANGVLSTDGLKAVYIERHSTAGAAYVHDIASDTRVALLNWTGNPEASGAILGLFQDRYALLVAQSVTLPGGSAYYVCDIQAPGCNEIFTRPGNDSLTVAAIARSFGGNVDPPVISVVADRTTLWPPNQKMVPINLTVEATGFVNATVECRISSIDATAPLSNDDWKITGDLSAELRAMRPGASAMTYTVTVSCTDGSSTAAQTVRIVVPHDQGQ